MSQQSHKLPVPPERHHWRLEPHLDRTEVKLWRDSGTMAGIVGTATVNHIDIRGRDSYEQAVVRAAQRILHDREQKFLYEGWASELQARS